MSVETFLARLQSCKHVFCCALTIAAMFSEADELKPMSAEDLQNYVSSYVTENNYSKQSLYQEMFDRLSKQTVMETTAPCVDYTEQTYQADIRNNEAKYTQLIENLPQQAEKEFAIAQPGEILTLNIYFKNNRKEAYYRHGELVSFNDKVVVFKDTDFKRTYQIDMVDLTPESRCKFLSGENSEIIRKYIARKTVEYNRIKAQERKRIEENYVNAKKKNIECGYVLVNGTWKARKQYLQQLTQTQCAAIRKQIREKEEKARKEAIAAEKRRQEEMRKEAERIAAEKRRQEEMRKEAERIAAEKRRQEEAKRIAAEKRRQEEIRKQKEAERIAKEKQKEAEERRRIARKKYEGDAPACAGMFGIYFGDHINNYKEYGIKKFRPDAKPSEFWYNVYHLSKVPQPPKLPNYPDLRFEKITIFTNEDGEIYRMNFVLEHSKDFLTILKTALLNKYAAYKPTISETDQQRIVGWDGRPVICSAESKIYVGTCKTIHLVSRSQTIMFTYRPEEKSYKERCLKREEKEEKEEKAKRERQEREEQQKKVDSLKDSI